MTFKKLNLPKFDLEAILNLLFYGLVLFTFIAYLIYKDRYPSLFMYLGFSAAAIRIVYYIRHLFKKN